MTRADRLFAVWAVVVLVFFSLSRTKQPGYILTGVIAAGVCLGRGLGYSWRNSGGRGARLVARAALALAGIALVSAAAVGVAVARGATEAGRLSAMPGRERAIWSMWPAFLIVFLAIAALGVLAFARRRTGLAVAAFALFPLALVTFLLPAVEGYALSRSAKGLAAGLASLPRDTEIACLNCYPPGLSFYLGKTLTIISEDATPLRSNFVLYWMPRLAARPATVVAPSGRDAWVASRTTGALIVATDGSRADLDAWVGSRSEVTAITPGWWGASLPRPGAR